MIDTRIGPDSPYIFLGKPSLNTDDHQPVKNDRLDHYEFISNMVIDIIVETRNQVPVSRTMFISERSININHPSTISISQSIYSSYPLIEFQIPNSIVVSTDAFT